MTNSSASACLRPRSISRSLNTIARLPFCCRKMNGSGAQNFVAYSMSGSTSLAATIRRVVLFFVLLMLFCYACWRYRQPDRLQNVGCSRNARARPTHETLASAHSELPSQNPMQQRKQSKRRYNQNNRVEDKYTKFDPEIAFLRAEENVRSVAAT